MSIGGGNELILKAVIGAFPNMRRVTALGNNPDVGAAEDIWSGGGLYPWMTAATSLEVVSSSASDAAAGTGARTVQITGLNASYAEISAVVTMNGVTAVAIPTQFFRINSATVITAGTTDTNVGNISIRDAGGGTVRALIPIGYSISRQSQYTVPAGYTMVVNTYILSINSPALNRDATIATFIRPFGMAARQNVELAVSSTPIFISATAITYLPEKTDFGLRVSAVSAVNTNVTGAWGGLMVLNTDIPFI